MLRSGGRDCFGNPEMRDVVQALDLLVPAGHVPTNSPKAPVQKILLFAACPGPTTCLKSPNIKSNRAPKAHNEEALTLGMAGTISRRF